MKEKIKVLIVDDSALMRTLLTEILSGVEAIEVVGSAADPFIAREKIKKLHPDVLTLDVEMPRMDGLTFLRNLMRLHPMPVVMLSTLTAEGADTTLKALEYGAVDFMQKPSVDLARSLPAYAEEIIDKICTAAKCRVSALADTVIPSPPASLPRVGEGGIKPLAPAGRAERGGGARRVVIALGASTGGTEAIKQVVRDLPVHTPPIVISQHLPLAFSASFAKHVDQVSSMRASLAVHGERIEAGHIYIAPGGQHLKVRCSGDGYRIELDDGAEVNRHRPSVDVMFRAVAEAAGARAIGILLTGMGADGARGMLEMHRAGALTLAQDETSSVVWGMPGEACRLGAVDHLVSLSKMSAKLLELLEKRLNHVSQSTQS